jgi:hypothetical protein
VVLITALHVVINRRPGLARLRWRLASLATSS